MQSVQVWLQAERLSFFIALWQDYITGRCYDPITTSSSPPVPSGKFLFWAYVGIWAGKAGCLRRTYCKLLTGKSCCFCSSTCHNILWLYHSPEAVCGIVPSTGFPLKNQNLHHQMQLISSLLCTPLSLKYVHFMCHLMLNKVTKWLYMVENNGKLSHYIFTTAGGGWRGVGKRERARVQTRGYKIKSLKLYILVWMQSS